MSHSTVNNNLVINGDFNNIILTPVEDKPPIIEIDGKRFYVYVMKNGGMESSPANEATAKKCTQLFGQISKQFSETTKGCFATVRPGEAIVISQNPADFTDQVITKHMVSNDFPTGQISTTIKGDEIFATHTTENLKTLTENLKTLADIGQALRDGDFVPPIRSSSTNSPELTPERGFYQQQLHDVNYDTAHDNSMSTEPTVTHHNLGDANFPNSAAQPNIPTSYMAVEHPKHEPALLSDTYPPASPMETSDHGLIGETLSDTHTVQGKDNVDQARAERRRRGKELQQRLRALKAARMAREGCGLISLDQRKRAFAEARQQERKDEVNAARSSPASFIDHNESIYEFERLVLTPADGNEDAPIYYARDFSSIASRPASPPIALSNQSAQINDLEQATKRALDRKTQDDESVAESSEADFEAGDVARIADLVGFDTRANNENFVEPEKLTPHFQGVTLHNETVGQGAERVHSEETFQNQTYRDRAVAPHVRDKAIITGVLQHTTAPAEQPTQQVAERKLLSTLSEWEETQAKMIVGMAFNAGLRTLLFPRDMSDAAKIRALEIFDAQWADKHAKKEGTR